MIDSDEAKPDPELPKQILDPKPEQYSTDDIVVS